MQPPHVVGRVADARALVASENATCFVSTDAGRMQCFGRDERLEAIVDGVSSLTVTAVGICGLAESGGVLACVERESATRASERVAAGEPVEAPDLSCSITESGEVACSGSAPSFVFGIGLADPRPRRIDLPQGARLAAGDDVVCALESGRVRCVGPGIDGSAVLPEGARANRLHLGRGLACAAGSDDGLFCWPLVEAHGGPDAAASETVVQLSTPAPCESVLFTDHHILCASEAALWSRLIVGGGDRRHTRSRSWNPVPGYAAGDVLTGVSRRDDTLHLWNRSDGTLRTIRIDDPSAEGMSRVRVPERSEMVRSTSTLWCALRDDVVSCFDLAGGAESFRFSCGGCRDLALGARHACALDAAGAVVCGGRSTESQLPSPAPPSGMTGVAAGAFFSCAHDSTQVLCWGSI